MVGSGCGALSCRMRALLGWGVYRVLLRKPEGKIPLERPRRRWVDNIRMGLQEVGCGYMDWIGMVRIETGGGRL